jgi:hypothetical protein
MKKLGKLQINPEKIMKNEELLTLRGGYVSTYYLCDCDFGPIVPWNDTWWSCYTYQEEINYDGMQRCIGGAATCNPYWLC